MNTALILLERIGASHRRMAAMADQLDWNGIIGEWKGIHPSIVELKQIPLVRLAADERAQAARQIAELIDFEERISARITPWMDQVRPLLDTFRKYPLEREGA